MYRQSLSKGLIDHRDRLGECRCHFTGTTDHCDKSIPIWLDVSMKRFEYVHPAGGNEYTSVKLTPDELELVSEAVGWCDVCKGWEEAENV